jgi:hypothetical protein
MKATIYRVLGGVMIFMAGYMLGVDLPDSLPPHPQVETWLNGEGGHVYFNFVVLNPTTWFGGNPWVGPKICVAYC